MISPWRSPLNIYSFGKAIVATPFKLLSALTSPIARTVGNVVTGFAKTAFKGLDLLLVKPIKNLVLKPLGFVTKGLAKVVAAPFKLLGNVATKLTNFISGGIDHLAAFTKKLGEHIKEGISKSWVGRLFKRTKEDVKEFAQHVKDAAIQFISPLTDFVKVTIKSVGQHIKDSVSSGFNKLLGGVGNFVKKLFGGKKDKDPNKPKKESTLARIWRETAPGQRTDLPTTIDPNMSQSQKRRTLTEIIKEENIKNKKAAEERRQLERNEKLIAKYTGNQRADFTEENKALAEYEAKKKGITIDWGNVETRKTTEDKVLKAQNATSVVSLQNTMFTEKTSITTQQYFSLAIQQQHLTPTKHGLQWEQVLTNGVSLHSMMVQKKLNQKSFGQIHFLKICQQK